MDLTGCSLCALAGSAGGVAAGLAAAVPGAVVVPMDGFHLTTERLHQLGAVERRGAPDTFDADGYVELLRRLRASGGTVRAPDFDRSIEEPVPDAIAVAPDVPLVITEGNYLLLDDPPWRDLRGGLDALGFVAGPEPRRVERLVARFRSFGWDEERARNRVLTGSDAANARIVAASRANADRIVHLD